MKHNMLSRKKFIAEYCRHCSHAIRTVDKAGHEVITCDCTDLCPGFKRRR